MGTIPSGTFIPPHQVIERRQNSCGVLRYLIDHETIGRGWVSSQIRGGKEEPIVEMLPFEDESSLSGQPQYITPEDSAREWYKNYTKANHLSEAASQRDIFLEDLNIHSIQEFEELLFKGVIHGMNELDSDSLVAATYESIADVLPESCSFLDCAIVLLGVSNPHGYDKSKVIGNSIDTRAHEVAVESLLHVIDKLPSIKALMARISMLRAFNRRARLGLPWLPLRSAQESSAVLGGLSGFGISLERVGRTWDAKSESLVSDNLTFAIQFGA